jgi:hypothetical protein
MKKLIIVTIISFLLGCQKTDLLNPADQVSKIDLQISGLNALGDSAWYEAWINGYSLGLLHNNIEKLYSLSSNVNLGYLQSALHILVTIEGDTIQGNNKSIYKIIAAKITANTGKFDVGNELILDFDFKTAQANYILDTPTDTLNTNLKRGIWFINLDTTFSEIKDSTGLVVGIDTSIEKKNGLELPELPEDWLYEGWVVFGSDTVSIGTFSNPIGSDNNSNFGAGLAGGYNFPGEDFINNPPPGVIFPVDLAGLEVFITIEPTHPENAFKPFTLIPFKAIIPLNCEPEKNYLMENNVDTFPNGNLSITVSIYD